VAKDGDDDLYSVLLCNALRLPESRIICNDVGSKALQFVMIDHKEIGYRILLLQSTLQTSSIEEIEQRVFTQTDEAAAAFGPSDFL
jgi:hypothetical protein